MGKMKEGAAAIGKRAVERAKARHEWNVPGWLIWLGCLLVLLALTGLVFGFIQSRRVDRWRPILAAAKNRIADLEAKGAVAKNAGVKTATSRAIAAAKKRGGAIDGKLGKLPGKLSIEKNKIQKMSPAELKRAFAREGF